MLNLQQGAIARDTHFSCLIYGEVGIGKTTFALGATKPLYLNCEKGAKRVELRNLTTVAQAHIQQFEELLQITDEDIAPYETIIIDTLGAIITQAQDYIMRQKKKLTFTIQDWGQLKTYIVNTVNKFLNQNKNVIIIAHEEIEQRKGASGKEETRAIPMAQGSAINVIETQCDIIGHMYKVGATRRFLDVNGNTDAVSKNIYQFPYEDIIIPEQQKDNTNNAFKKIIEARVKAFREKEAKEAPIFNELLKKFKTKINVITTPEHCTLLLKEINEAENVLSIRQVAKEILFNKTQELGFIYDGVEQIFKKGE